MKSLKELNKSKHPRRKKMLQKKFSTWQYGLSDGQETRLIATFILLHFINHVFNLFPR
jgi:hypothetical protein